MQIDEEKLQKLRFFYLYEYLIKTNKNKQMKKGIVKFFNETKGFGFIKEESGEEIFVHVSGITEDIRQDDNVIFDTQEGKKGLNAVNVRLA